MIAKVNFFVHTKEFSSNDVKHLGNQVNYFAQREKETKFDLEKYYIEKETVTNTNEGFKNCSNNIGTIVSDINNFLYEISIKYESYEDH